MSMQLVLSTSDTPTMGSVGHVCHWTVQFGHVEHLIRVRLVAQRTNAEIHRRSRRRNVNFDQRADERVLQLPSSHCLRTRSIDVQVD